MESKKRRKRREERSAKKGLAEKAAQRETFNHEEAAIRRNLRRLSRRTRVLNAMNSPWTIPMIGLVVRHIKIFG